MIPSGKTKKMVIGDFSVLVLKSACDNSISKRVIKIFKVKGREAKISGCIQKYPRHRNFTLEPVVSGSLQRSAWLQTRDTALYMEQNMMKIMHEY